MPPFSRFDSYVSEARMVVTRLSSHDADFERGLTSGTIVSTLSASVQFAIGALEMAYGELGDELALRCELPVGRGQYRLPISTVMPAGRSNELMDSLRDRQADLAVRVRSRLEVATTDGWLGTLMHLARSPAQMNLRRAVAAVSVSKGTDGTLEMNLRTETGEPIPMFAPVLLQESSSTFDGIEKGYYLAVLPEAREVVSFLDRCVRGMSSLGDRLRTELISSGY